MNNMKDLIWKIEGFFHRIRHSWRWTKLGWGFHPTYFEYTDAYATLKFSIERMIESFETSRQYYLIGENELQYMRLCIKLIDRLQTGYYEERGQEELEKRWGKCLPLEFKPNDDGITYRVDIRREREVTEEDSERYTQDLVETYNRWAEKHRKARKLLFRIMDEKIETWWI